MQIRFTLLVRDNATIIIVVDELLDLIGLQGIYQRLDLRQILVAFLNSDYIYISSGCFGIIALIQQSIVCNSQDCIPEPRPAEHHLQQLSLLP